MRATSAAARLGERGSPFVVVDGQVKHAPAQRFHRRRVRGRVSEDQISADILVEQGVQIAQQDIEFDSHRDLAITGWEFERQRLVCGQDLAP